MENASKVTGGTRSTVRTATADAVHEFAERLSDEFLQCRELGHTWRPHTATLEQGYYERRLRCPRCRCIREEQISMRGIVLRRQMIYADGYLAKNMGRIMGDGRGQLRLASIERQVETTTQQATQQQSRAKPRKAVTARKRASRRLEVARSA